MHIPKGKRKLLMKIRISCLLISLDAGGMDLLCKRIIKGDLAVAECVKGPVLKGSVLECFGVHLCSVSVFKIKLLIINKYRFIKHKINQTE